MTSGVRLLCALLEDVVATPGKFSDDQILVGALRSQGALAHFTDPQRGIVGTSLNTQKARAEADLEHGYEGLNARRLAARDAILKSLAARTKPAKTSKASLLATITEMEEHARVQDEDLELISDMLNRSMRQARVYAEAGGSLMRDRCKKEQAEILALLGPKTKPRLRSVK